MLLKLILWFVVIAFNVWVDRKGRKPDYLKVFIFRGVAAICHGAFVFWDDVWEDFRPWYHYGAVIIFQVSSFWILFEAVLNKVRGNDLLYFDTKELDSGWVDRLFATVKNGKKLHLIAKVVTLIFAILSFVYLITLD